MKSSLTLILVLFTLSGLLAQTDCTVKVVFAMNKSLPPGYAFKTDPQPEGAKYSWSFGDNTYSDSSSPTHTYRITGTYTVMVKVTASVGKVCYGELKASFEGLSNPILSGRGKVKKLAVAGCDLVIALENGIILIPAKMTTDFQIKEGQYLELTYEKLATKITDCREGTEVRVLTIKEISTTAACKVPVIFTKSTANPVSYVFKTEVQPEGSKYLWQFGDGGTSEKASPTYAYKTSNAYVINLKVVDPNGKVCYGELKTSFEGQSNPILSGRGKVKKLAVTGCDLVIALENGIILIPAKMTTDFQIKEGQYLELTYEKLATKITDCREGTEVRVLTIKEISTTAACKAYFTATNQLGSDPAMMKKMVFANLSTGDIKECTWNFGDNTTSTELKPSHEYAAFGEYKVCLSVTTVSGCKSEYCAGVKVAEKPVITGCKFDLVIKPREANPNSYLFFAVCPVEIKTWNWNFGDGKISDAKNPEHTYEKAGIYEVSCTITTAAGCTETRTIKQNIMAVALPNCQGAINLLLFDPTGNICNGKATVKLMNEAGVEIKDVKYLWSDGRTGSTVENLCPDKPYTVQAIIDFVCQKNTSFTLLSKPVWRASAINGQNNFTVISPKDGVLYEWDFGNGKVMTGAEVNFNFENDGVYNVKLKAVSGNDFSEYTQQVVVLKSVTSVNTIDKPELTIYPNPVKEMLQINFGNPVEGNLRIEILNITGECTQRRQLDAEGYSHAAVNIQQLKSGIYFLRIFNGQQLITNQKFIKTD